MAEAAQLQLPSVSDTPSRTHQMHTTQKIRTSNDCGHMQQFSTADLGAQQSNGV
jgi:hypothetical protein